MPPRPLVISHRTNMGSMPENTLAGIDAAIRDGADGVEIDVRLTADGVPVLLHDATLERTTGDPRSLADVTLEELSSLTAKPLHQYQQPESIPTLEEVLRAVDKRALLVIELKEDASAETAALVEEAQAGPWCWIWSFAPDTCSAAREAMPEVPAFLNWSERAGAALGVGDPIEVATERGLAGVSLHHAVVEPSRVATAREAGLKVSTWTVNERADIDRVRDAGVDAICGDVPPAIAERLDGGG